MKYVAKEDCYGYRETFYKAGEVVEPKEGEEAPPKPFEPVEKPAKGNGKNKPDKE